MRPAAEILKFPPTGTLRPAKARLSPNTQAGVRRLIALAPVLGQRNPRSVPAVERVMLNLIGEPPEGGLEHRDVPRATAARAPRRQRHGGQTLRNVEACNDLLTAVLTEQWETLANLKVNAR